jgi:hypothetical protein
MTSKRLKAAVVIILIIFCLAAVQGLSRSSLIGACALSGHGLIFERPKEAAGAYAIFLQNAKTRE